MDKKLTLTVHIYITLPQCSAKCGLHTVECKILTIFLKVCITYGPPLQNLRSIRKNFTKNRRKLKLSIERNVGCLILQVKFQLLNCDYRVFKNVFGFWYYFLGLRESNLTYKIFVGKHWAKLLKLTTNNWRYQTKLIAARGYRIFDENSPFKNFPSLFFSNF